MGDTLLQSARAVMLLLLLTLGALRTAVTMGPTNELPAKESLMSRLPVRLAGAYSGWFHLFRLLVQDGSGSGDSSGGSGSVSVTLEQFIQTSTAGEFSARMDMLDAFRFQLLVLPPHAGGGTGWAARMAAVLGNMSAYYRQFQPSVEERLAVGRTPLDKDLADFVKLAKWEDRGYYAMKQVGSLAACGSTHLLNRCTLVLHFLHDSFVLVCAAGMGSSSIITGEACQYKCSTCSPCPGRTHSAEQPVHTPCVDREWGIARKGAIADNMSVLCWAPPFASLQQ